MAEIYDKKVDFLAFYFFSKSSAFVLEVYDAFGMILYNFGQIWEGKYFQNDVLKFR